MTDLPPALSRVEAIEWATEWAERNKLFVAPAALTDRYAKTDWQPPSPQSKLRTIIELAEWVLAGGPLKPEKEPVPF